MFKKYWYIWVLTVIALVIAGLLVNEFIIEPLSGKDPKPIVKGVQTIKIETPKVDPVITPTPKEVVREVIREVVKEPIKSTTVIDKPVSTIPVTIPTTTPVVTPTTPPALICNLAMKDALLNKYYTDLDLETARSIQEIETIKHNYQIRGFLDSTWCTQDVEKAKTKSYNIVKQIEAQLDIDMAGINCN